MFQVVPSKIEIKDDEDLKTTIAKMYELIDTINLRTILLDLTMNYLINEVEQNKKITEADQ